MHGRTQTQILSLSLAAFALKSPQGFGVKPMRLQTLRSVPEGISSVGKPIYKARCPTCCDWSKGVSQLTLPGVLEGVSLVLQLHAAVHRPDYSYRKLHI